MLVAIGAVLAVAAPATTTNAHVVAAPPPMTPVHKGDPIAIDGATFAMPVDGWLFANGNTLSGDGLTFTVGNIAEPCAKWTGSNLVEDWIPTMFWPYETATHGLCLQRVDHAIGITVTIQGKPAHDHAAEVLAALGDALRPPAKLEGMSLRLPMPVGPSGDHKYTASDGAATFEIGVETIARTCGGALAAAPGDRIEDDPPAPWRPQRVQADDGTRVSCVELADRGVALTWPAGHDALRMQTMRAIAEAATAAWGPAVTNASGQLSVLGAPMRLDPATAGEWKVLATSAQQTELALIGQAPPGAAGGAASPDSNAQVFDAPFALRVIRDGACATGDAMPDENTRGFAPTKLQPVQRVAQPPAFAMCVHSPRGNAAIAIEPLSPAGEPPSGAAAVHVHTLLLELAQRYFDQPDGSHDGGVLAAAPVNVRAPAETHVRYRADAAVWAGGMALTPPSLTGASSTDAGALAGADLRGSPKAGFGLAAEFAAQAGYANGYQEQASGAVGAGVGIGALGVVAMVGGDLGEIGARGNDILGEAELAFQLGPVRLLGGALRTHAYSGTDQWRYELRASYAQHGGRGTIDAGVQWFEFDHPADTGMTAGKAVLIYIGVGFASEIDIGGDQP